VQGRRFQPERGQSTMHLVHKRCFQDLLQSCHVPLLTYIYIYICIYVFNLGEGPRPREQSKVQRAESTGHSSPARASEQRRQQPHPAARQHRPTHIGEHALRDRTRKYGADLLGLSTVYQVQRVSDTTVQLYFAVNAVAQGLQHVRRQRPCISRRARVRCC
jgi:hypothetical protein